MSWDLYVFNLPPDLKSLDDLPKGYEPPGPLGQRSVFAAKTYEFFPEIDASGDPSWLTIFGDGWSIEVSLGDKEEVDCICFHVRGDDGVVEVLSALFEHLGVRVYDIQAGDFFKPGAAGVASFHAWKGYREQVAEAVNPESKS